MSDQLYLYGLAVLAGLLVAFADYTTGVLSVGTEFAATCLTMFIGFELRRLKFE